tara:strand:- start:16206 stop:16829 length:624 start_codon:yes stop_codon:yes gene_type:complete
VTLLTSQNRILPILIVGAGGHACVVADALLAAGNQIIGFTDTSVEVGKEIFQGLRVLGCDDIIKEYALNEIEVAIGIGFLPGNNIRYKVFNKVKRWGFTVKSVQHPSSIIASEVILAEGSQIMAGSIVQAKASIGKNVIVNTGAKIDHDTIVGDHTHIAPGATICGGVKIGENCFVGAGSTVIQGRSLSRNAVIAAGTIISKSILDA